jgi:RNA polymerase sigma factor (sigma-70 family)
MVPTALASLPVPVFQEHSGLLRRFRGGEREALEIVYRRYVDDVMRVLRTGFVSRRSGALYRVPGVAPDSTLLDMTQEVFARAFAPNGRAGYDGLRPYRPYLLQIARNLRIDQLRREGRELSAEDAGSPSSFLDLDALLESNAAITPPDDAHDDPAWLQLREATRAHVASLSAEEQRFVELRFVRELPQIEVAELMAVTRRRVRTLEALVLRSLRKTLKAKGLYER